MEQWFTSFLCWGLQSWMQHSGGVSWVWSSESEKHRIFWIGREPQGSSSQTLQFGRDGDQIHKLGIISTDWPTELILEGEEAAACSSGAECVRRLAKNQGPVNDTWFKPNQEYGLVKIQPSLFLCKITDVQLACSVFSMLRNSMNIEWFNES